MVSKEKPSKKNRKNDRDSEGSSPVDHRTEEKLLVLPCGPSAVGIMLLIILSGFYVVRELFFLQTTFPLYYMNIASR
jgi:dolichyl-diphosphooligosaccharide--protein glycosyltransferase